MPHRPARIPDLYGGETTCLNCGQKVYLFPQFATQLPEYAHRIQELETCPAATPEANP